MVEEGRGDVTPARSGAELGIVHLVGSQQEYLANRQAGIEHQVVQAIVLISSL